MLDYVVHDGFQMQQMLETKQYFYVQITFSPVHYFSFFIFQYYACRCRSLKGNLLEIMIMVRFKNLCAMEMAVEVDSDAYGEDHRTLQRCRTVLGGEGRGGPRFSLVPGRRVERIRIEHTTALTEFLNFSDPAEKV